MGRSYDLGMKRGMMTLQIVHQMFVIIVLLRKKEMCWKTIPQNTQLPPILEIL